MARVKLSGRVYSLSGGNCIPVAWNIRCSVCLVGCDFGEGSLQKFWRWSWLQWVIPP